MIDIKLLQKNFEKYSKKLIDKKVKTEQIDKLKNLSETTKIKRQKLEKLKAEQNSLSKEFGFYIKEKKDISSLKENINNLKSEITVINNELNIIDEQFNDILLSIPNFSDDDVPIGDDENSNIEIKQILEPKNFDFQPKEHWELSEKNGWIDFKKGVKLAKSRFSVLAKDGARIERALINYMLDFNRERGFEEFSVPFMANSTTLQGTGQLPKFEDDLFKIEGENLYMIPTAEVSLTNLFQDEIIQQNELPLKMTSYTPCFRKEAGSAGRDTKGMIRQHQFAKVELVSICESKDSDKIFDEMVQCASDILTSLELPHKHIQLCTGDLGFSAAKTVDLEVWFPGQNRYREISSISNTRDFQARRAKIRFKNGKKNELVHTLNGSSLAVGRTLIALMENHQNIDGSINIPEVLKKYL